MVTDTLTSFKDNIKRRLTNPFLGTFSVVYIIHNWELFYGIFNFDPIDTQKTRLDYIRNYFANINSFWNLAECILYTLLVLLFTYLLLGIGRLLANAYEDYIVPLANRITGNSRNVSREVYQSLQSESNEIQIRYEKEREDRNRVQKERDILEAEIIELKTSDKSISELSNLKANIESMKSQLAAKNDEVESLKKQSADKDILISKLNNENKPNLERQVSNRSRNKSLSQILYDEIKNRDLNESLHSLFKASSTREKVYFREEDLTFFIENNILTLSNPVNNQVGAYVTFTSLGDDIYNLSLIDKFKNIKMNNVSALYKEIVKRFPAGRLASYLLNNNEINVDDVIYELIHFTQGHDSDRRYTDEQSKIDAQSFIDRLKNIEI